MANRPLLYLVDGHAVAYRQFHALPEAAFSTKSGEITNAVYGFTRILIDILIEKRPKYLAVSFDAGLSGRENIYSAYKAQRPDMPVSLDSQIKRIYEVVKAFNIPILQIEGYEADDVMGTITKQAEAQNVDVHIITGDRDILQLLSDNVRVQLPAFKNKADMVYDIPAFIEKYQIRPDQLVDLKALMGDTSDNIPGVKGIGEKTGTSLLLEYDTLDGIYNNIEVLKGATKTKLLEGKESAYLSQDLARIRCDLPIQLELQKCVTQDFNFEEVSTIFRDLEFRSLFDRLESYNIAPVAQVRTDDATDKPRQLDMFGSIEFDEGALPPDKLYETVIVQDKATLDALAETLNKAKRIVWDVETTSVDQMAAKLVGIALAVDFEVFDEEAENQQSKGYYIPVGHNTDHDQIETYFVMDAIRPALTNPNIEKIAHNAIYDLIVVQRYGLDVKPVSFDTMLAEWVRDPISKFLGLKNFARQYLDIRMTEISELIGSGKAQRTMDTVSIERAAPYAVADAVVTMKMAHYIQGEMEKDVQKHPPAPGKLTSLQLMEQIEMPIVPVIADMQRHGVKIDVPFLREMSVVLQTQIQAVEQEIYRIGGVGEFNIGSPKQLNEVLFDKLKLSAEGLDKTTHGFSTRASVLDRLKSEHPIIEKITEYRELTKLKSTYVDALPALVNRYTGRVHTSYNQTGSSTGRFSSSDPNLQNIPIRSELGRAVRKAFIAPEGEVLLAVDYSQIELRVMAHISEDKTLVTAFEAGQDIHRATAAAIYGVALDEVEYAMRDFAKRVNFGLIYGMGSARLARESDLTEAEARRFIARYFESIPGVKRYLDETENFVKTHGYVETLLGRRRNFAALIGGRSSDQRVGAQLRAAINMPIQGTAADILKIAMINLHTALKESGLHAALILQVHDELVLEVPEDEVEATAKLVIDTMQNAYQLRVPIVANAEVGKNWLDMQDLT
jgi:DNA polymerase I